ncbi:hypothetical protein Hanom_Chr03g00184281 [Helianthus anomalus]
MASCGLLCLNDFLLSEVPMFCVFISHFFLFFSSFLQASTLLSFVSFSFVLLQSPYLSAFFFPVSDFSTDFTEVSLTYFLTGSSFCFGLTLAVGLPKFFIESFSLFLASSSASFSKIGAGVVLVNFARDSFMPLISACVYLYLASTIFLTSSICVLC